MRDWFGPIEIEDATRGHLVARNYRNSVNPLSTGHWGAQAVWPIKASYSCERSPAFPKLSFDFNTSVDIYSYQPRQFPRLALAGGRSIIVEKIGEWDRTMNRYVLLCKNRSSLDLHFFEVPEPGSGVEEISANFACPTCRHVYAYIPSEIKVAKQEFKHEEPKIAKVAFECGIDGCKRLVEAHTPIRRGETVGSIFDRLHAGTWQVQCEQRHTPRFPSRTESGIVAGPFIGNFSYPFRPILVHGI
jgi:hypothetical protein